MGIIDWFVAVAAGDVFRDVVHRPRAVEGDQGDDVVEAVGLEPGEHVAHARAFELEHANGLAAPQHLVRRRVVERQRRRVDLDAALAQQPAGAVEHGEGLESEEVELDQPGALGIVHGELGHRHVRAWVAVKRHQLVERPVADDHAGGVGSRRGGRAPRA